MGEFETGPQSIPGFVRDVNAGKLRETTFFPDNSFDENGCFRVVTKNWKQETYFSANLLNFNPQEYGLHRHVDRTYYVVPKNVDEGSKAGFVEQLRISAARALHLPFESMRIIDISSSGDCFANEDGDLYLQSGIQIGSERFTMRVEASRMGSLLHGLVFDEVQISHTRRFIKPDGVVLGINDLTRRRELIPRQIILKTKSS